MPQPVNDLDNKLIAWKPIPSPFSKLHKHSLYSINYVQSSYHYKPLLHATKGKEMCPILLLIRSVQNWQQNSIDAVRNILM